MSSVISFQGDGGSSSQLDTPSVDEDSSDFFNDHPVVEASVCYGWLFILFYCLLCRKTRERPSTAMGDSIRARAREYRERLEHKQAKLEQSPEERKRLVDESLHTKVVLSKDAQGNMILGNVDDVIPSSERDAAQVAAADVETPQESTGTAADKNTNNLQMDEDEDAICVICLDSFEPGDLVSWSKHDSNCTHVFHTECIRQWLVDRRQDECPSCRCCLVKYPNTSESDIKKIEGSDDGTVEEEVEVDTIAATSTAQSKDESSLFVIMHGLISRTVAPSSSTSSRRGIISRRPSSAPASGEYNLVSVKSNSFDNQDGPEQEQDLEDPSQHDDVDDGSTSSLSSSPNVDDEESDGPRWLPSQGSSTTIASVATESISEALRRSEVMEDEDDEETEDAENPSGGQTMELDMEHAVMDIVFSH